MLKDIIKALAIFLAGFFFVFLLQHTISEFYYAEPPLNEPPQEMIGYYEDQLLKGAKIDE